MSDGTKQNLWSMLNTALLILITITGFFVVRWMNEIEAKLKGVVTDISAINSEIRSLKSDRDYEKGRMQGIKEALEARRNNQNNNDD
jgi:hypothetical protein